MTRKDPAPTPRHLHQVTLSHTFEAAHRLPHLGGKCTNLHGHSWKAHITISAPSLSQRGIVVEFGTFKNALRTWVDRHLDHAAMLGVGDPLCEQLRKLDSRLFTFGLDGDYPGEDWPTVEAVAMLLAEHAQTWLDTLARRGDAAQDAIVARVDVEETATNRAGWVR